MVKSEGTPLVILAWSHKHANQFYQNLSWFEVGSIVLISLKEISVSSAFISEKTPQK